MDDRPGSVARGQSPPVVVSNEEWTSTVDRLIQRDYFPLAASKNGVLPLSSTEEAKRVRLDKYMADHVNEAQATFADLLRRDAEARSALFSNKKDFLRPVELANEPKPVEDDRTRASNDKKLISDQTGGREVDPSGTRFQPPGRNNTTQRRLMLRPEDRPKPRDFDLVSMASRTTARSARTWYSGAPGQKPLSDRGLALVEKLRKSRKEK